VTVGITISKAEIDNQAGGIARSLFATLANVQHFKSWLDGLTAQNLVDNYGYTLGDANILKSAFTDMGDLAGIFNNTAAVASLPHDYRAFAKQLIGTGIY
jgi:hypothetical protein